LLLLLLTAFAGCSGKTEAADQPSTATAASTDTGLPLPRWAVGDAWTYKVGSDKATYVVTGETGGDWTMETDSPERAFQNLRDDVSRLGPQRKSDLAGSQGTDRVEFFQWPLTEGKTWGTQWDHHPVTITAHLVAGAAHLEARAANGTLVYRYTYDAATRWFHELHHYAADGSELIGFTLEAAVHNWTGAIARWDLKTVTDGHGDLSQGFAGSATYDVPLTATDVWLDVALTCATGTATIGTAPLPVVTSLAGVDPRGGGVGGQPCPQDDAFIGSIGAAKASPQGGTSETWGWSVTATPTVTGNYHLVILVRTLHLEPRA
jgi:hypothetical protein